VLVVVLATAALASADDHVTRTARPLTDVSLATRPAAPSLLTAANDPELLERRWPGLPTDPSESEEDVIVDHLSALGNQLGKHMTFLSDQMIGLHVDGRAQRARLRVGTGTGHYLAFKLDSDWYFADGKARINAKLQLGLAGHELSVQLPAMEMEQTNYHGNDGVILNLPLLERRW
jgi:hypothetical protein